MSKIFFGLLTCCLLAITAIQSSVVFAAECVVEIETKDSAYSLTATSCLPNTVYVLGGTGSKEAPYTTSDENGNLLIADTIAPGTYSFFLFNGETNASVFSATVVVGDGSTPPLVGGPVAPYLCAGEESIRTVLGCIPIDKIENLLTFFVRWTMGVVGGVAMLLIIAASYQIITSRGDKYKLQSGKEMFTAAITGLVLAIFAIFVVQLFGQDILQIF